MDGPKTFGQQELRTGVDRALGRRLDKPLRAAPRIAPPSHGWAAELAYYAFVQFALAPDGLGRRTLPW